MRLDHVTIAGPDLSDLERRFAGVGLETEFGGVHSNGATHMSLLGFEDGSYVELISLLDPGAESPLWHRQIVEGGGPAAWAVVVEDMAAEVDRLRTLGLPVRGPIEYRRARPDGAVVEWELAFPGDDPPGATHPFLICDRTPRERRVRPSPSVASSELVGIDTIVLAVRKLERASAAFQRFWGGDVAVALDAPGAGARLLPIPGLPVVLARPLDSRSPLAARIERFGESPCAFLVRSRDLVATARRIGAPSGSEEGDRWFGRRILWLDPAAGIGSGLGFVE